MARVCDRSTRSDLSACGQFQPGSSDLARATAANAAATVSSCSGRHDIDGAIPCNPREWPAAKMVTDQRGAGCFTAARPPRAAESLEV
jgi:hypothetical protein